MARYLLIPSLSVQSANPTFAHKIPVTLLFLIMLAVFSVFSITTFLCASNKNEGFQRQKKNNEETIMSSERKLLCLPKTINSKHQLIAKMICWRKVEAEEEEEDYGESSDEAAVWRKRIMMGERCRPLDFSGKILYDCEGNLVPAAEEQYSTQSFEKMKC